MSVELLKETIKRELPGLLRRDREEQTRKWEEQNRKWEANQEELRRLQKRS